MADNRPRKTSRRRGVRAGDDPAARARWRRTSNLAKLGMTGEQFNLMLAGQEYACAMCHRPFEDGERIHVDHDHDCCPFDRKSKRAKSCGKCLRGLLCMRCNTALGYIEMYGGLAEAYLGRARRRPLFGAGSTR